MLVIDKSFFSNYTAATSRCKCNCHPVFLVVSQLTALNVYTECFYCPCNECDVRFRDQPGRRGTQCIPYSGAVGLEPQQLDYLLGSRVTLTKGLFIGCRYTPFVIYGLRVRMVLSPSVEISFVLRTYALWNCDPRVRIALLVMYLAFFCGMTILLVGCGLQSNKADCYILAGLLFTIINIATICFVPGNYGPVLEAWISISSCIPIVFRSQIVAQGLLATRMQLDLWKLNRHSLLCISNLTEYDPTDLEFELPQRASSFVPSGTVPVIQQGFDGETISFLEHVF
ncbi:hypothetical protein BDR07DRAFT_1378395 [Suillus spraguei]|nr:hypothetical protein BDR07DRAFT_1378395 [Suillus spraguei]